MPSSDFVQLPGSGFWVNRDGSGPYSYDADSDTFALSGAGGGGGGGGVTVQDDGTPLATTGTTLNFTGAGPTNVGNVLTTSPSGIAAGSYDFTISCASGYGEGEESFKYRVTVT